jgi:glycosyltransferase involved in cell wall biosynthesis
VLSRQSRFAKRIAILDNVIPHERRFFDHAFNRYFLNRNDGFIAMTEKVKNDLLSYIPDAKCMLIPHPIYNHFGARLAREEALRNLNITVKEDSRVLLFFGIIRDYKGLDVLIQALSLLDNRYVLIIAGEAYGDFKKYEKCMERFEVKERCFVFERYIGDEEVPNFFSAGDVCVLPYKSATQSGITGIAQHFELPVIATNVGGLAETIAHNKTGLIVDHVDPAELASQIGFYFDNQCRESFAVNIQNQNKENNWGSFVKKLEAFVQEI